MGTEKGRDPAEARDDGDGGSGRVAVGEKLVDYHPGPQRADAAYAGEDDGSTSPLPELVKIGSSPVYRKERKLGKGGFGQVFVGRCVSGGGVAEAVDKGFNVCRKKMNSPPSTLCRFCLRAFRFFVEYVVNLRFYEEPNYAKYISLFDVLVGPNPNLRPVNTAGVQKKRGKLTLEEEVEQFEKRARMRKPKEKWICVFNSHQAQHQKFAYDVADTDLTNYIERGWEDGFMISSVTSCKNLWALIMDSGTGFTKQIYKLSACFPDKEWIEKQWEQDYRITAVAGATNGSFRSFALLYFYFVYLCIYLVSEPVCLLNLLFT